MSRPPTVLEYLIEQDFVPQQEGAWFDRHIGQAVIRVVYQPGEETELICLAPAGVGQYKIAFAPGTPHAVTIAAVKAALTPPGLSARP
jgi:hypothetical protein